MQKSGYFSRSAAANEEDLELSRRFCAFAVKSALAQIPGVIGEDEQREDGGLRAIEFPRIKGNRPFDAKAYPWFTTMMTDIHSLYP